MQKWISVNDRMPERNVTVLCYAKGVDPDIGPLVFLGSRRGWKLWSMMNEIEVWMGDDGRRIPENLYAVTHWMYLPEMPKEVDNGK